MARRKDAASSDRARRRLGRGLESLISAPVQIDVDTSDNRGSPAEVGEKAAMRQPSTASRDALPVPAVQMLLLEEVRANPRQPRGAFDDEALHGLARSIEAAGIMQPIVVRPRPAGGFEIVAGERRWRAAQLIGLPHIPAVVRELDDRTAAQWSLVENLQREDLNPIERAEAFQRLIDEFDLTHQQIADRVGLDRSSVTNHLRLRELDDEIQEAMRSGVLGMGHGRTLLAITNINQRRMLGRKAMARSWSVRELERQVRSRSETRTAGSIRPASPRQLQMQEIQRRLGEHLGTKVAIRPGRRKGTGTLTISFFSLDEFDGLMQRLGFSCD